MNNRRINMNLLTLNGIIVECFSIAFSIPRTSTFSLQKTFPSTYNYLSGRTTCTHRFIKPVIRTNLSTYELFCPLTSRLQLFANVSLDFSKKQVLVLCAYICASRSHRVQKYRDSRCFGRGLNRKLSKHTSESSNQMTA